MADMKAPAPNEAGSERRRSHRVNIAMPILVRGKTTQPFQEQTHTISVNAHGCVFRLAAQVKRLQEIAIVNSKTAEELPCKVTFLGQKENGKTEVGVEFSEPSPLFWRIAFPPEDWDPSERKRPGGSNPSPNPNGR
jgi:c-di-GMP-binding flagellar brake protein YcgR